MWNETHQTDRIFVDLADTDAAWGPLLFLRPQPTQPFGVGRVVLAAVLLGVPQGLVANLGMATASRLTGNAGVPFFVVPLTLSLALALLLHLSIGRAWNRRVERLRRTQAWLELTRSTTSHDAQPLERD